MNPHRNVVVQYVFPAGPQRELLEQCDDLVVKAASGDARALSAVVVMFGEVLVERRAAGAWDEVGVGRGGRGAGDLRRDGARHPRVGGLGAGAGGGTALAEEAGARAGVGAAGGELARDAASGEPAAKVPVVSAVWAGVGRYIATATDEELLEQLDELVAAAVGGDRRAIGAIAIAHGPALLKEARRALGKGRKHQAGYVLQRFFLAMTEGTMAFAGKPGTGLAWMKSRVRAGAREAKSDHACAIMPAGAY